MSPVSEPLLQVRGLCSGYGSSQVLFDVDLDVPATGGVAILGRNGAGKTTLLNTILGVVKQRAGSVRVGERDVTGMRTEEVVKSGLGYVPQNQPVFPGLTVRENLLIGAMGGRRGGNEENLERVLAVFPKLSQRLRQAAGTLSGGERKMVAISRALLGDPQILVLDEPTDGVWIGVVKEIGDRLTEFAHTRSVVVVEQHLDFALKLADRAYVMDRGAIVMESSAATIREDPQLFRYLAP